jgi:hypothetical protein
MALQSGNSRQQALDAALQLDNELRWRVGSSVDVAADPPQATLDRVQARVDVREQPLGGLAGAALRRPVRLNGDFRVLFGNLCLRHRRVLRSRGGRRGRRRGWLGCRLQGGPPLRLHCPCDLGRGTLLDSRRLFGIVVRRGRGRSYSRGRGLRRGSRVDLPERRGFVDMNLRPLGRLVEEVRGFLRYRRRHGRRLALGRLGLCGSSRQRDSGRDQQSNCPPRPCRARIHAHSRSSAAFSGRGKHANCGNLAFDRIRARALA